MARLTAVQKRQAAAARREARFENLVRRRFGNNASANPNNVNAGVSYYTPPQPDGAVTAPRDTIVIQNQPQARFVFRGRIIYTP